MGWKRDSLPPHLLTRIEAAERAERGRADPGGAGAGSGGGTADPSNRVRMLGRAVSDPDPCPDHPPPLKRAGRGSKTAPKAPRGSPPGRRVPNQAETDYALRLRILRPDCLVEYEPDKLPLAARTSYTPDFKVTLPDGSFEYHEVKGPQVWEKNRIKLKVAAQLYQPIPFFLAQVKAKAWTVKPVPVLPPF
jgi:hypothetical protein